MVLPILAAGARVGAKAAAKKVGKKRARSAAGAVAVGGAERGAATEAAATAERFDARTVGEQFKTIDSLEARAYRRNTNENDTQAGDAEAYEEELLATQQFEQEERVAQIEAIETARRHAKVHATSRRKPVIGTFSRWMGLGGAITAYFFQFLCAAVSLIGLASHAVITYYAQETWIGSFLDFFLNLQKNFPGETFGMVFWGLATLIAFGTFLAFLLWYYFTGVQVFHSSLSTLITAVCLALAILPISNLFPWIVLWILYINSTTLFSDVKRFVPGS